MANEFVKATKVGELSKVRGYDGYGGMRVREVVSTGNFADKFIELPTLPEMMRIVAGASDVEVSFFNDGDERVKDTVVPVDPQNPTVGEQADLDELEAKGIENAGVNQAISHIIVPAGETVVYRKRHEKFMALKGAGTFEAW